MEKSKYILVFIAVIIIVIVAAFIAIKQHSRNHILDGPGMVRTQATQSARAAVYPMDDLLQAQAWLGKTKAQLGVEERYYQHSAFLIVSLRGRLFGEEGSGDVYFSVNEDDDKDKFAQTVFLRTEKTDYATAKEKLTALYGEPYEEIETPYVEVNGGAVTACRFRHGDVTIELSVASERDYLSVRMEKDEF